jgi:hypothetical protein
MRFELYVCFLYRISFRATVRGLNTKSCYIRAGLSLSWKEARPMHVCTRGWTCSCVKTITVRFPLFRSHLHVLLCWSLNISDTIKQDRQFTYNVILRRVRETIFAVEKQQVLHTRVCVRDVCLSACSLIYPTCNAHAPYCHPLTLTPPYFSTLSHKRQNFLENKRIIKRQRLSAFLIPEDSWKIMINFGTESFTQYLTGIKV